MTLPPCVVNLPPESNCPSGYHWNGVECVPDATPSPNPTTNGNGNILYVSTLKGLAICTDAYGSDGTDGDPTWVNGNGSAPNHLTGNAVKIRWFNLDPFSLDPTGTFLTAGWAMTDDGFYRVENLPNNPTWTQQLSIAQAASLIGATEANTYLLYRFAPSVFVPGYVGCAATRLDFTPGTRHVIFYIYSTDYGATWNCDTSNWIGAQATAIQLQSRFRIESSFHVSGRMMIGGWIAVRSEQHNGVWTNDFYDVHGLPPGAGYPIDTLYLKDPTYFYGHDVFDAAVASGHNFYFPYQNNQGVVYPDDNVGYCYGVDKSGVSAIRRSTILESPLWRYNVYYDYRASTNLGDAAMGFLDWFFTNALNENYGVAIQAGAPGHIWLTPNLGLSWTHLTNPTFGGRAMNPRYLYCAPANPQLVFFCGNGSSGSLGAVGMTSDFGATLVDISKPGLSDGIDAVMGLSSSSDMDNSVIMIDRVFSGVIVPPGATAAMIDVSHYQGTINWTTAFSAGITDTFIKASQGSSYTDPQFATNWTNAQSAGIRRGSYHYFENATDPTVQANHFVAVATSAGELGYAVDCEDETTSLTPSNLKIFLDRVETLTGQKCVVYTRASWWNKYVGYQSWASDYPLWVAHWNVAVPTLPIGWSYYTYWQFSSLGTGATYGAQSAFIDLDKVNG